MSKSDVSQLQDHLGYWLRSVSNAVSGGFVRRVEEAGVSVGEWVVLRLLFAQSPMMSSRVAEEMGMTKGAITKLADRLLAKGLVSRQASADDKRVQFLSLTAAGKRLVPILAAVADENDEHYFRHLSADERASLDRLLRKVAAAAGIASAPMD